jgi:uncharacterized membrane protein
MPHARLFVILVLYGSLTTLALAQQSGDSSSLASVAPSATLLQNTVPEEPRILSDRSLAAASAESNTTRNFRAEPLRTMQVPHTPFRVAPPDPDQKVLSSADGQGSGDETCYAIRSYLVQRDSKDSDSTHMAGYSTCRPSIRYHVKTIQAPASPAAR